MTSTIPYAAPSVSISGGNLMTASEQWRNRPADECYWNIDEMYAAAQATKTQSMERDYDSHRLIITADDDARNVQLQVGPNKAPLALSYHAFGQLAGLADGAPAGYLRRLPAMLAADCLSVGLQRRARASQTEQVSLMAHQPSGDGTPYGWTTRALTGTGYSRLWTADLLTLVKDRISSSHARYVTPPAWTQFGGGLDPNWTGPTRRATAADVGPFTRVKEGDIIRPAGCYYSTGAGRDSFLFLLNTEREIGLPNGGSGYRFLLLWNSEVGAASVGGATGLCDIACGNHIIWGASQVKEFRFRHVGEGLSARSYRELSGAFGTLDAAPWETDVLQASTKVLMGDTRAEAQAKVSASTRLPLADVVAAMDGVSGRDYGRPLSAYAIASALTEYSQTKTHAEDRLDIDRAAGKLYSSAF